MKVSKHAIQRFQERAPWCESSAQARHHLRRLAEAASPVTVCRLPDGTIELFPKNRYLADGWLLVIEGGTIITCYQTDKEENYAPEVAV